SVTDDFQGSSFKSTYRAYVSPTQPAGSYVGRVRYTMVHPSSAIPNQPMTTEAGKIGYYPNANGFVVDTMGDQEYTGYTSTVGNLVTPLTPGGEATLWASNFKRPGYGFVGWSDTYDYVANVGSATNPNAKIYGPNETITTPSNLNEEGLSLYAVWVESAGTIQNWSCPNNTTMPIGTVTALTDLRDNNTYAVAKLKDGKCWMIENLRLGGNNPITLTPNDSDVYSNFTLNSSVEPILANWCITLDAICTNQSLLNADNSLNPVSITTTPDAPILSYGNYYNWYSATAGTGTYSAATNNTQVSSSVCPKGWKLPAGGKGANVNTNDYRKMSVAVTGMEPGSNSEYNGDMGIKAISILRSYPNNFVFSGMIEVVPAEQRRSATGHYWTSTVYSLERAAYLFDYNYVLVRPSNAADKFMGFTIRCLAN
ncbi:hypothetical protein IKF03_01975, partial [Candidatus Saccharibacteria bacterium]|nr:hypothetical protein [Candidatus Saccharibacteria bacterium]